MHGRRIIAIPLMYDKTFLMHVQFDIKCFKVSNVLSEYYYTQEKKAPQRQFFFKLIPCLPLPPFGQCLEFHIFFCDGFPLWKVICWWHAPFGIFNYNLIFRIEGDKYQLKSGKTTEINFKLIYTKLKLRSTLMRRGKTKMRLNCLGVFYTKKEIYG